MYRKNSFTAEEPHHSVH